MQGASRSSLASLRDVLNERADGANARTLGELADTVFSVVTLFAGSGSLRRTISDPALTSDQKLSLVDNLFAQRLSDDALAIVREVARLRWSSPRDVVDALEAVAVEAALQQAETQGVLDEVEDELFRFERIVESQSGLRAALTDRYLPTERKRELLHRLLDGKVADVSLALIERAALAPRGRTVERVLDEFTELAAARRERLIAHVTSAVALSDEQQEALAEALRREFGRNVRLQVVIDDTLIGGLTVRVGDELIDGSVLRHLGAARRQMSGGSGVRGR